jgi:hypothetical protein
LSREGDGEDYNKYNSCLLQGSRSSTYKSDKILKILEYVKCSQLLNSESTQYIGLETTSWSFFYKYKESL